MMWNRQDGTTKAERVIVGLRRRDMEKIVAYVLAAWLMFTIIYFVMH